MFATLLGKEEWRLEDIKSLALSNKYPVGVPASAPDASQVLWEFQPSHKSEHYLSVLFLGQATV